jgi:hypothetical protein
MNKLLLHVIFRIFLLSILIVCSCNLTEKTEPVSNSDIEKLSIEIPKEIIIKISKKCKKTPEPLKVKRWKQDRNHKNMFVQYDSIVSGLQFSFVSDELAHSIWKEFHNDVKNKGHYLYLKNLDFDKKWNVYYDIAITKTKNQFSLLEFMNTSAPNYDLENADIISKLKEWNSQAPFKLVVVDEDRIEAIFLKLPHDMNSFCQDVYEFCPDVIDQGYGSIDEMIKDFSAKKFFWMWWD